MKIAECTSCGSKFDVSPYKPGSKLRCAKCKAVFVVPDGAASPSAPAPAPASKPAAATGAPSSPAGKKNAEDSFFPEDSEAPKHDWHVSPNNYEESRDASVQVKISKPPTRATPKAPGTAVPAASGPAAGGTRRIPNPGATTRTVRKSAPGGGFGAGAAGAREARDLSKERRAAGGGGKDRKAAPKSSNPILLMVGSVGAMVAAVGLLVYSLGGNPNETKKGPGGGAQGSGAAPADDFASKKAKTNLQEIGQVLGLASWCEQKGMVKERDELYEVAGKLDPKQMVERFRAVLMQRVQTLGVDDANAHWELVEWCDKHGLKDEAERLNGKVLKINKNHAGANKRNGLVLYEGSWQPADMVEALAERAKKFKDEAELLASMDERGRDVYKRKKELTAEFGQPASGPDIEFLDAKPYLLCLQKSKKYASDLRLSDFSEITSHLFDAFYKMYAEKFELKDMKEAVVVIFVFEDRDAYMKYGQTIGIPPYAGGHYEQGGKKRLMIYNDCPDPYETIFHEGMHQLVDFATMSKGKKDRNMFWFTEGVATYFENFKRDPKEGFILGEVSTTKYLPAIKAALRHKKFVPLDKLVQREYPEVVGEAMKDPTQQKIGIYYAESWSLTHFFYKHENGKYKAKFEEYFKKEVYGQGGEATFKEIFGDPAALQDEWIKYVEDLK
ncbi:MAG: DUF1570 domain-containing protein [Planctomycetes bacterium]|nr:DUF1570 domain-containing protein [Planctomycetota bacterium]